MRTVIYHSADFDGIFCREIAKRFLGTRNVNYVGWNHGEATIPMPDQGVVFILDLAPDCLERDANRIPDIDLSRVVWIDHHKSSIERWGSMVAGYRIDGVAACRLAWQWFSRYELCKDEPPTMPFIMAFPGKQEFVNRTVVEPLAVRLAGEYDVGDRRDLDAGTFQYGLRANDLGDAEWRMMLEMDDRAMGMVAGMICDGAVAQRYAQATDADLVKSRSYRLNWEGLDFLGLNTGRFNSLTFAALDVPESGHDALLGYGFDGTVWRVSLYHARHRTNLDLSLIAVKHGGGGHRGACGFTCQKLPWIQ